MHLGLQERQAQVLAFVLENLIVLVDHGDSQENTRAAANGAKEIRKNGESADAQATKASSNRNVLLKHLSGALLGVAALDKVATLGLQLLGNVTRGRVRNGDPELGKDGARCEDERDVEDGMNGIVHHLVECLRRGDVMGQATNGEELPVLRVLALLPLTEDVDQEVGAEAAVQDLREEVDVGYDRRLQDDGHVGCVEELDVVVVAAGSLQRDLEVLQKHHNEEDKERGQEVDQVRELRAIEGLFQCAHLVVASYQQVEKGDDGAFELRAATSVNGGRTERFPHDRVADVSRNEEARASAKTPALLQQLVEKDADHGGNQELKDNDGAHHNADLSNIAVHARSNVRYSLNQGDAKSEQLLRALKNGALFAVVLVDVDDLDSSKQLHDERGRYNWANTQLHECAFVGRKNHTHPIKRVRRLIWARAEDWDLAANQEDEQRDGSPQQTLLDRGHFLWLRYFRDETQKGLHQHDGVDHWSRSSFSLSLLRN